MKRVKTYLLIIQTYTINIEIRGDTKIMENIETKVLYFVCVDVIPNRPARSFNRLFFISVRAAHYMRYVGANYETKAVQ